MTFKKLISLSMIMIFALATITMTSCAKEKGCTNEYSDNYNADAEEDDDSCIAWSEKFLGEFEVTLSCAILVPLNAPFTMTVTKTSDNSVSMILATSAFGNIPLSGIIDGDNLTFNEFAITDQMIPFGTGGAIITDLTINGDAVLGSDKNLSGTISVNAVTNGPTIDDSCPMVAIRQ